MNLRKAVCFALIVSGFAGAISAQAAETTTQAKLVKKAGTVTVTMPGGQPAVLNVGDSIRQGASVTTGANSEAYIQTFDGAVATMQANTSVDLEKLSVTTGTGGAITQQTAVVNLKSGNVVSTIDPSKKNINNYSVRTPKGVAAARGTQFTVSLAGGNMTIASTSSSLTFTMPGGAVVSISQGQVSITPAGSTTASAPIALANAAATNPEIATIMTQAVSALASCLSTPSLLGSASTGNGGTVGILALTGEVMAAAANAVPSQAAAFTSTVVAAAESRPGNGTGESALISAAVQGAMTGAPAAAAAIATSVVQSTPSAAATVVAAANATGNTASAAAVLIAVSTATGQSTTSLTTAAGRLTASIAAIVNEVIETPVNNIVTTPIIDPTIVSPSR